MPRSKRNKSFNLRLLEIALLTILFLGYFVIFESSGYTFSDFPLYLIHAVTIFIAFHRIMKLDTYKEIVYLDTIAACTILAIYILSKPFKFNTIVESTIFYIILIYITIITVSGLMKLSFKNIIIKNTNTEEENAESANGFAYLNDMADELSKMERLEPAAEASLEDILNAEINDLEVSEVKPINDYEAPEGLSPKRIPDIDFDSFINHTMPIIDALKKNKKKSYVQSMRVAAFAAEAAKYINADSQKTKAISYLFLLKDLLPYEDLMTQEDIYAKYEFPECLCSAIDEISMANSDLNENEALLSSKETALVFVSSKISSTYFYVKAHKPEAVNVVNIVDKAFTFYITKGTFNNSGLSLKDCSEIRRFFIEKLNSI